MSNRIDSFVDAFTGWLAEYQQKQKVSCGTVEGHGVEGANRCDSVACPPEPDKQCRGARQSGYQAPPAGIHLVDREISQQFAAPSSRERNGSNRSDQPQVSEVCGGNSGIALTLAADLGDCKSKPAAKFRDLGVGDGHPCGAAIHLRDREISLGTHPQGCVCLECGIEQKFEEPDAH